MVFIGKSIDRLVNSIDSYIWLLEIWSIFPFDRIMLGIINIFDSIGMFRTSKLYPIPEISSPRSKNFAKERKKLMALRMSETTSSWEWFQLEGNNDAGSSPWHMLRSSFTSQFRWAALHYGHLDISYLAVVRFAGTSIEKEREKEGVRRRSEKIRVVFEQVSLPSSNPDHYSTPGAIEQPATWLIVSQTILSNVCEPAMNSRQGNIYTCIPFITPYRNRSSKIANCIQFRFLVTHRSIVFLFSKKNSPILYIPRWSFSSSTRV